MCIRDRANGGTIFLDEVAELPLATQVRLLRVLESGEFLRVGSSRARKTNVRVIAATNVNLLEALHNGRFREDLYYRLNTVPIHIPPLRDRTEDIPLLFRKFASDFAEKFRMPPITLSESAQAMLINYNWPGNVRQLKNITEQISVIEEKRVITPEILQRYLPDYSSTKLPALIKKDGEGDASFASEREILYKILFDMRNDVNDLKKLVLDMLRSGHEGFDLHGEAAGIIQNLYSQGDQHFKSPVMTSPEGKTFTPDHPHIQDTEEIVDCLLYTSDAADELPCVDIGGRRII